jgi:hypothetical protein
MLVMDEAKPMLRIFVYQSSIFLLIVFLFIIICHAVIPYDYSYLWYFHIMAKITYIYPF